MGEKQIMAQLTVAGKEFPGVLSARVEITHEPGETAVLEATNIPIMQFVIDVPLTYETYFTDWALEPQSTKRFREVILKTTDRDNVVKHTWNLKKAYVHHYHEMDMTDSATNAGVAKLNGSKFHANHRVAHHQGNYMTLILRGSRPQKNEGYTGVEILTVEPGTAEVSTGAAP